MELQVRRIQAEMEYNNNNPPVDDLESSKTSSGEPNRPDNTAPRVIQRIPTYLQPSISLRERIRHFTFAWYTVTMSTGGIALTLALTPHRFPGLDIIGLVIFLFNLLCFVIITSCLLLRFMLYQNTFSRAFTRPSEALFISTFFLSIAAMLSNICAYGNLFLNDTQLAGLAVFLRVTFWFYLGITFLFSVIQYHLLFTVKEQRRLTINSMTPAWILPIFPIMLAGTLAAFFSKTQAPEQAIAILSAGLASQGLGMLVSFFMYATYLSRLMAFGLPAQRPGMFIAVGPPSFTCAALLAMASDIPRVFASPSVLLTKGLISPEILAEGIKLAALYVSMFLWGLSFWFFTSAIVAVLAGMPDRRFHLSWWSFVFPNVGFTIASIRIGEAVESDGVLWLSTALTIMIVIVWAIVASRCVFAVVKREIVWPGHDEDSN